MKNTYILSYMHKDIKLYFSKRFDFSVMRNFGNTGFLKYFFKLLDTIPFNCFEDSTRLYTLS